MSDTYIVILSPGIIGKYILTLQLTLLFSQSGEVVQHDIDKERACDWSVSIRK